MNGSSYKLNGFSVVPAGMRYDVMNRCHGNTSLWLTTLDFCVVRYRYVNSRTSAYHWTIDYNVRVVGSNRPVYRENTMKRNHRPSAWSNYSDHCRFLPSMRRIPSKRSIPGRKPCIMAKQNKSVNSKNGVSESLRNGRGDGTILSLVLDAKQRQIDEVENQLFETRLRYETIRRENKTLKSLQKKQEIELDKLKSQESELPMLISHHVEEQRVLRSRLKKAKAAERILEEKVRDNNDALQQMEGVLVRLNALVQSNALGERAKLAEKLSQRENDLQNALGKIDKLDRLIELSEGSFSRQLSNEKKKHRSTLNKLYQVEEDHEHTKQKLKKKVKELNDADVYTLRRRASKNFAVSRSIKTAQVTNLYRPTEVGNRAPSMRDPRSILECSKQNDRLQKDSTTGTDIKEISGVVADVVSDIVNATAKPPSREAEVDLSDVSNISFCDLINHEGQTSVDDSEGPVCEPAEASEFTLDKIERAESINLHRYEEQKTHTASLCPVAKTDVSGRDCHELVRSDINYSENFIEESKLKLEEILANVASATQNSSSKFSNVDEKEQADKIRATKELGTVDIESGLQLNSCSPRNPKKPYVFSKEVENLHRGIPSIIPRNKKRTINCNEFNFGNYTPTFCETPKRSGSTPYCNSDGNINQVSQAGQSAPAEKCGPELKGTKESDLLIKLFGKIEIEKEELLGLHPNTSENKANQDEEVSKSQGHGDSYDIRETNLFKSNEISMDRKTNREIL